MSTRMAGIHEEAEIGSWLLATPVKRPVPESAEQKNQKIVAPAM